VLQASLSLQSGTGAPAPGSGPAISPFPPGLRQTCGRSRRRRSRRHRRRRAPRVPARTHTRSTRSSGYAGDTSLPTPRVPARTYPRSTLGSGYAKDSTSLSTAPPSHYTRNTFGLAMGTTSSPNLSDEPRYTPALSETSERADFFSLRPITPFDNGPHNLPSSRQTTQSTAGR